MRVWPFYSDRELRAMYPAGRADATARRLARFWAGVFSLGLAPRRWVTLEVRGRRSGRPVRFPLGMADWNGQWFLVSMLGEHCNWVQNVRAADGRAVLRHGRATSCELVELPAGDRAPVIRRYLDTVPGARPHIPVSRDAALADVDAIAPRYPVFLVVPQNSGPAARREGQRGRPRPTQNEMISNDTTARYRSPDQERARPATPPPGCGGQSPASPRSPYSPSRR